jgi:polysaccharide lyase-like protein
MQSRIPVALAIVCIGVPACAGMIGSGTDDAGFDNSSPDAAAIDAGGVDAGSRDAGPGDAGGGPGCSGARLCDDFESYAAGKPPTGPWTVSVNGGTVVVDSVHARSGTQAVHVSTDGLAPYRQAYISVSGAPVFPVPGNVVFGRMMIWLTAAPTMTTHWTNIQGEGPVAGQTYRSLTRYGGQVSQQLMANYETAGVASDCWQHSQVAIPVQRWACFEWRFNAPNDEMDFWLDGTSIPALTVIGQGQGCISNGTGGHWYFPQYDTLRLGWEHYQTSIPIDMWIDDVAVDSQRIGCP